MQRKFLRNLALLLVLNLLIKPFWIFGIDRTVQNTVGAEEYGFYFAVFNFSYLFYILLDFGITTFNNRNIAQNNHLLHKHLSNIVALKFLLFLFYLAFTFVGAFFINYSTRQLNFLLLLCFNQFLVSFISYLRSNLGGLHLFKTDSVISVLDRSLMIFICVFLLWGNLVDEFRIIHFVYAQTVSLLITALISLFVLLKKAGTRIFKINWNTAFFVMMIRQSFPFAVLVLLMTFYSRLDSVMLERLLSEGSKYAGIYASAFRLLDAASMFAYLFAVLLLPIFSRMLKNGESIEDLIKLSYTLLITPAIIIAIASLFYADEFMRLLYPIHAGETTAEFEYRIYESSRVFALLMCSFCAISTMYIFSTLLTANNNLKHLNIIAFSGVVTNIVLNFILIPHYQAYGSAVATIFTQFLIAVIQVVFVSRIFKFNINNMFFLRLLCFIVGTILLAYFSKQIQLSWHLNVLIFIISSILFAMTIRFLHSRGILQIIRYGEK